jgi:serine/threonine protein kinase
VHRDLKPANIICYDHRRNPDFVKVLDFGIAKVLDQDSNHTPLTREGIVCGTPAFMSPEQVQGLPLDNRSDLFSLGIILYQTLTGKLPFLAESAVEVATKIVMEKPLPPSAVRSDWTYPPEFEKIVLKLLNKNREERYAHALEVRQALEECLAELKERRDAALDFSPDELADIVGADHMVEGGTDTVRLDEDMVSDLLNDLSDEEKKTLLGDSDSTEVPSAPSVNADDGHHKSLDAVLEDELARPPVRDKDSVNLHHVETMELKAQLKQSGNRKVLMAGLIGFGLALAVLVALMYLN